MNRPSVANVVQCGTTWVLYAVAGWCVVWCGWVLWCVVWLGVVRLGMMCDEVRLDMMCEIVLLDVR